MRPESNKNCSSSIDVQVTVNDLSRTCSWGHQIPNLLSAHAAQLANMTLWLILVGMIGIMIRLLAKILTLHSAIGLSLIYDKSKLNP